MSSVKIEDPECVPASDARHIVPNTATKWLERPGPAAQLCAAVLVWSMKQPGCCLGVSRTPDRTKFAMPGGKVDQADWSAMHGFYALDPERASRVAASRELHEETGIHADHFALRRIFGTGTYRGGTKNNHFVTLYLATHWDGEIRANAHDVAWVEPRVLEAGPFGDVYTYAFDQLGVRVGRF